MSSIDSMVDIHLRKLHDNGGNALFDRCLILFEDAMIPLDAAKGKSYDKIY